MMKREKEEPMDNKMWAKGWKNNASKTAEAVILLDLITTLRKSHDINQGEVEICMKNREIWKRIEAQQKLPIIKNN